MTDLEVSYNIMWRFYVGWIVLTCCLTVQKLLVEIRSKDGVFGWFKLINDMMWSNGHSIEMILVFHNISQEHKMTIGLVVYNHIHDNVVAMNRSSSRLIPHQSNVWFLFKLDTKHPTFKPKSIDGNTEVIPYIDVTLLNLHIFIANP